jgi:hypothetical protein
MPVSGSQQEPSVQGLGWHLSATHVGVLIWSSQTWSAGHGGSHEGTHAPPSHFWPAPHVTPAHEPTQVKVVKSSLGLQT